jgi:hypothetical protein
MRVLRGTDTRTSSGKVLFSPLWHRADGQRCLLQLKPDPLNGGGARENTLSTFEYMSVMHSIVLALGIARVLGGFADVARDWRVIEAKWRFLGWLLLLLVLQLGWWFGLWARFSTVEEIGLSTFLVWFMVPASMYAASRLLIPEFPEGAPPNLERRFSEVRVPFFACLVVGVLPPLPALPGAASAQWLLAAFAALAITGVLVPNPRWHTVLLLLMLATFLTWLALARSTIGG